MKWLAETYFRLRGWVFEGSIPPDRHFIVVGAPHTSNWDFVAFLAAIRHWNIRPKYLGKHTLFEGPFGWLFRRWGGIPVDRSKPGGIVGQVKAEFASNEDFALVIAPEGTRKAAPRWKSGFLKIAQATGAPIVPAGIDFSTKVITLGEAIHHQNVKDTMDRLRAFYLGKRGRNPDGEGDVRVKEESTEVS